MESSLQPLCNISEMTREGNTWEAFIEKIEALSIRQESQRRPQLNCEDLGDYCGGYWYHVPTQPTYPTTDRWNASM